MTRVRSTSRTGHQFSQVPRATIPRSTFKRDFGHKTTLNSGLLVPIYVDEALPGDTFNLRMTAFVRLATPIKPVMDNLHLETFFFAVPNRLVWDNWQKFMGEREDPTDSIDYTTPKLLNFTAAAHSLHDYFGIPTDVAVRANEIQAMPYRAYFRIWNEWFRDQNLQDSDTRGLEKGDGPDTGSGMQPLRRGKRHDYFTSCLPWPQKGEAVTIGIGEAAPIYSFAEEDDAVTVQAPGTSGAHRLLKVPSGTLPLPVEIGADALVPDFALYANLADASAISINDLRQAFQMQKLLERDARGGTRYTEIVKSHFGVTSPDARLQRPEYLGGGSTPVQINPIAQTTSTDETTPQGNLAAIGIANVRGHGFTKSFTEHCILIGLACVRADITYQQGLNRMWTRSTRYDFYWPSLSHIGEQSVASKELYYDGTASDEDVFGYQERYAEYRYKPSQVTGEFRSTYAETLDVWHYAQHFLSRPVLGATFIEENPEVKRTMAIQTEPEFLFDSFTRLQCARPMPVYGVPGLIDHF